MIGDKHTTINTATPNLAAAKQFLRKYLQGESAATLAATPKQHIGKIASAFAQAATGQSIQKTHLTDALAMWLDSTFSEKDGKNTQCDLLTAALLIAISIKIQNLPLTVCKNFLDKTNALRPISTS